MKKLFYNVRVRLILVTTCMIIFIAVTLSSLLYSYTESFLQKKMAHLTMENLSKYSINLRNILRETYETALRIATQDDVLDMVKQVEDIGDQDSKEALHNMLLEEAEKHPYIYSMYIYVEKEGQVITSNKVRKVRNINEPMNYPWIVRASRNESDNLLSLVEFQDEVGIFNNYFYAVSKEITYSGEQVGILSVNIDAEKIYNDLLTNIMYEEDSNVMLISGEGQIISHYQRDMLGQSIVDVPGYAAVTKHKKGYYMESINNTRTLVVFITEFYSNYKLVYSIPMGFLSQGINNLKWYSVLLSGISILFGITFVWAFSKHIYVPILTIKEAMVRFGQGDLKTRISSRRQDEFQVLYSGFNDMATELTELFNETIAQRLKIKEEQYKALQRQISPHFIYNTLNSIKCSAVLQKDKKTIEMLDAFIQLLEVSVNQRDMISLKEEVRQVANYILLQKHRFGKLFNVKYDIQPEVEDHLVPKLILQPLVENSLYHGINLREGKGLIYIKAYKAFDGIFIEVYDNGTDADIYKLEQRLHNKEKTKFNGIGIHNINERIKLIYGQGYGLSYKKDVSGLKAILHLGDHIEKIIKI
ncbi:cache domain-containing sensor histidine kinase [Vallitalea okinawensis]|uniref:cache domain-containing sensor histidine kinase n=1 Tax=Vallitalea okinawensis TaxID=2078660 RepID=UPI000CFBFC43|nr:sensor histidine kinase [Vallitalea okinawensis]